MESLPVTSPAAILQSNSRSTSPARPSGLVVNTSKHHAAASLKKSEPLIVVKSRKKSPLLGRKPTPAIGTGSGIEVTTTTSQQPSSASLASVSASTGSSTTTIPQPANIPQNQNQSIGTSKSQSGSSSLDEQPVVVSSGGSGSTGGSALALAFGSGVSATTAPLAVDDMGESSVFDGQVSNASSSEMLIPVSGEDVTDGSGTATPDLVKTKLAIEHINQKIQRTMEMMKNEQSSCDENVNEYLKLASNADKQQLQRIKSVFEKKNQKSVQTISQLQKKLDNYNKRIKDLEMNRVASHRQPKEVLRDVGQGLKDVGANIRDGITGFSGGVVGNIKGGLSGLSQVTHTAAETKPNSGSLPNAVTANSNWFIELENGTKYTSEDECSSVTSGSGPVTGTGTGTGTMSSPRNHAAAIVTSSAAQNKNNMATILPYDLDVYLSDLKMGQQECQHDCQRLHEEMETLKAHLQAELSEMNQSLQEERYKCERLEDQLNDLIELHQNEIENLKQCITDMEEKVQYQSEERLRDTHEMLETCQTKISRLEHQQHQRESMVIIDGIENSNARAVAIKLINVLLTVLQVILLVVATISNILMPFLKTRVRILTTTLLVLAVLFVCRQWSDVDGYLQNILQRHGLASSTQRGNK